MQQDFEILKKQIKSQISNLINDNKLEEANSLISEYFSIVKEDIEVYSMKAIVLMLENKFHEAEKVLKIAIAIDKYNFDINYNLAYLNEKLKMYDKAIYYYEIALLNCNDKDIEKQINNSINYIKDTYKIDIHKKKIVFFVKQGMDSFLNDIINGISDEYETRKIIVTEYNHIDEGMKWADICWFEWCDELIGYGSRLELSKKKKIICRIHGYEVYTEFIRNVNWKNVNELIIVAPHIRRIFEDSTEDIDKGKLKINTVFCGVNLDAYPINNKQKGFNLGYLGYINFKKNLPLTLDIFKKLHDIDNKYKLYFAGESQDERTFRYIQYFVKENELYNSVQFDGWKDAKSKIEWFKKINYMVISSIDEGLCYAAAESMSSGVKPILHNCEGIKDHYPQKYIFNNVEEAVSMIISDEYNSIEYRKFIQDNYSLSREYNNIREIIKNLK
ncbi:glycosyltransferase [Clostridium sp. JS66]|uniref:glycosyltransferase n=1 Tax=Clostridium sp. JS66 TaxID=3064705 RepID=UPI00298DC31D|nr:glycosyltransferase [Clostridium sp. JS66]WPC41070.1 glycosyltransferase [Clostridium sp. JS66]